VLLCGDKYCISVIRAETFSAIYGPAIRPGSMHVGTLGTVLYTVEFAVAVSVVLVMQWFGVGVAIERSLVQLPAGALSSQLGQLRLPSLRGR